MKTVSPIFENGGKREVCLLALTVVLILALCTLIATAAFASTEAETPTAEGYVPCKATFTLEDGAKKEIEGRIKIDDIERFNTNSNYSTSVLFGMLGDETLSRVHPGDVERVKDFLSQPGTITHTKITCKRADGTEARFGIGQPSKEDMKYLGTGAIVEQPKMRCKLTAIAHYGNMFKTTRKFFDMAQEDATVLSAKFKEIAERAKAGGNKGVSIYCSTDAPGEPAFEYEYAN
ncbi:MAG: hypothetical protein ACOYU2_06080 [Nitrospirota bacterium]